MKFAVVVLAALAVACSSSSEPAGLRSAAEACLKFAQVYSGASDGSVSREEGVDTMIDAAVQAMLAGEENPDYELLGSSLLNLSLAMQTADQEAMSQSLPTVQGQCDAVMTRAENQR